MQQDFTKDFESLTAALHPDYDGKPVCCARFGDGEYAIMRGIAHKAKSDGWEWSGQHHPLRQMLFESLTAGCELDDYFVGVSAANHHPNAHKWYVQQLTAFSVPMDCVTFASLFIFANYERFRDLDLSHCFVVGNGRGVGYPVPIRPDSRGWDNTCYNAASMLAEQIRRPIIVSAGPWSSVLIHRYWQRTEGSPHRQTIIDVGSALDEQLRGRKTRKYQYAGNPMRGWVPRWERTVQDMHWAEGG
jgi:hypothetical protein